MLLSGSFPQSHQMVVFAFAVFSYLKNQGVQTLSHPPDGSALNRDIGALVKIVRAGKDLLRFLKTNSTLGILPQSPALARVEMESHVV